MEEKSNRELLIEYVKAINYLYISSLEELLVDDFHYVSQLLENSIEGKKEYLNFLISKLRAFKHSGWSIIGRISTSYSKDAFELYMISEKNNREVKRLGALRVFIEGNKIVKSKLILVNKKDIDLLKNITI